MPSRIKVVDRDFGYNLVCSGYLVENGKVLLVHHNGFNKWVPPGGHLEAGETFAQAAEREFEEETGIAVEALSAAPTIHPNDSNATALPLPFYIDVEVEGFAVPTIVQFFYMRRKQGSIQGLEPQLGEVYAAQYFGTEDLASLQTFEQVKSLATYALTHHPDAASTKARPEKT